MALLINGTNYSWANITVALFGTPIYGITKINYKESQVKENNYGLGKQPVSRGYGNVEYEGEIEIYYDELVRITTAFGGKLMDIPWFDMVVVFGGAGVQVNTLILRAVEFKEESLQANQGDTKLLITIPIILAGVERR